MTEVKPGRKGVVGRPRVLTREQVIDAAAEIGPENITMKAVAAKVGVTVATLYQYVADRDELLHLAIGQIISRTLLPADQGQHWSVFVGGFADAVSLGMGSDPTIVARFAQSGAWLEEEAVAAEYFLAGMTRRGFLLEEATEILRKLTGLILGASVIICRDRAQSLQHGSTGQALNAVLARRAPDDLPLLRQTREAYAAPIEHPAALLAAPLIAEIARRRGEPPPHGDL